MLKKSLFCLPLLLSLVASANPEVRCRGVAPAWNLSINESDMLMRFQSEAFGRVALRLLHKEVGVGPATRGRAAFESQFTVLRIEPGGCRDAQTGSIYSHSAVYDVEGRYLYRGCCQVPREVLEQ